MAKLILHICGFGLLALVTGCVPDEDTSPSAALFPTTHYGEVRPDFTSKVASRAARTEVELFALFGVSYNDQDRRELESVQDALNQGFYANPTNGKKIYRIQSLSQAQQLLQHSWKDEKWVPDSILAKHFLMTPNASVALIGQNDQRILFFDQSNQLAGVYPEAG